VTAAKSSEKEAVITALVLNFIAFEGVLLAKALILSHTLPEGIAIPGRGGPGGLLFQK